MSRYALLRSTAAMRDIKWVRLAGSAMVDD
jgi:hypothetical protein